MNRNSRKNTRTEFKWKEKVRTEITNLVNEPNTSFREFRKEDR
jgi:hypothetical protein